MQPRTHEDFMLLAVRQAEAAAAEGEVPAGCVIVTTAETPDLPPGTVIGRAHNQVELLKDPTAHAEMIAITQAAEAVRDWRLTGTVLYVTKEPCIMCAGAIVLARIPTVVYGAPDPRRGGVALFNALQNPSLNHRCEVVAGVLADRCAALLTDFFRARRE